MVPTGSTLPMLSWAFLPQYTNWPARVNALGSNEKLRPLLKPVRIAEDHLGEGRAVARVVDDG